MGISSAYLCTLLTLSLAAETCYEGPGGASPTEARAGGHNIQVTKAMISKPAPPFSGTAVLNGEFTELKLSDYLGKYLVFFFYPLDFTLFVQQKSLHSMIGLRSSEILEPRLWLVLLTRTSLTWLGCPPQEAKEVLANLISLFFLISPILSPRTMEFTLRRMVTL